MKTDDRKGMKAHTMEVTPGVEQAVNLCVINTKSRLDTGSYSFCLVQTTSNWPQGNVFISKTAAPTQVVCGYVCIHVRMLTCLLNEVKGQPWVLFLRVHLYHHFLKN